MGIVYKPDHDPKWLDRPTVILVARDEMGDIKKEVVDLKETDGGGHYKRSIVKTLDPYQYHIDIAKYFL
jgi:hypothetical protein